MATIAAKAMAATLIFLIRFLPRAASWQTGMSALRLTVRRATCRAADEQLMNKSAVVDYMTKPSCNWLEAECYSGAAKRSGVGNQSGTMEAGC
jgi:hypothetical protein